MSTRPASFCLVVTLLFAIGSGSAHAQGAPPPVTGGAIQALFDRIAALEARVAAIETIDLSDIVGTYQAVSLGIEMNGGKPERIKTSTDAGTMTLNADGTGIFAGKHVRCSLTGGVAGCETESGSGPFTWSYANGVITIGDQPGDQLIFTVTHSGTMIAGDSSEFLPGNTWAVIFMFVKVP